MKLLQSVYNIFFNVALNFNKVIFTIKLYLIIINVIHDLKKLYYAKYYVGESKVALRITIIRLNL